MPGDDFDAGSNYRFGRDMELAELRDLLLSRSRRIVVIHGAPGSGKTSLALQFARQHRDRFPGGTLIVQASLAESSYVTKLAEDKPALFVIDEANRVPIEVLEETVKEFGIARPKTNILMTTPIPIMLAAETYLVEMPPLNAEQVLELLAAQTSITPERLDRLVPLLAGNAAAAELASQRLAGGVPPERIVEWFEGGRFAAARDVDGRPLAEDSAARKRLDLVISEVSDELIAELSSRPEMLYELDHRKFEQLVAELYRRRGFETVLTPSSGDEGADVYVVSRSDLGKTLWIVQAKRHAPERKIEAGVVRELLGTVTAKNASAGILITTSFFQPGARSLEREFQYRLSLKDYLDLRELLRGADPSP